MLQAVRHETNDPGLFHAFGDMGLPDSPLPPIYGKAKIGSFGLSEIEYGSDPDGLQTRTQEEMHARTNPMVRADRHSGIYDLDRYAR